MSGDGPSPSPVTSTRPGPKRCAAGPLLSGMIAAAVATFLMGSIDLFAAIVAVSSWWTYKFWPHPAAQIQPEAQAFIDRLDGVRPDEIDLPPPGGASSGDVFRDFRL